MSSAKDRMRHKKMKNQPSNVTYSSSPDWRSNGSAGTSSSFQTKFQHARESLQPPQTKGWIQRRPDGGVAHNEALPKFISASVFAKVRAAEISAMLKAVNKPTASCHVYSSLPKHMRRRAMSHNTKRLPCRLREMAHKLIEKSQQTGKKEQSKAKSRKARRRHGSLLLEFNRRQRKNKWLETHIWHAKRFHMQKKWGYCLGARPTYKCYRASYRAMSSGCLLQDVSYYCCVELRGPEDQLLKAVSRLTSSDTGPTFAAACCLSGQREGNVLLYKPDQYPHQLLGPAHFLWRPCSAGSSQRQLWIWMHPILKQDVLHELQEVCQCFNALPPSPEETQDSNAGLSVPSRSDSEPPCNKRKRKNQDGNKMKPPAKKILGDGTRSVTTPRSWKSSQTEIVINDLTMDIVRFRLIGPLSNRVLSETLLPASKTKDTSTQSSLWWPEECKNTDSMSVHRQQADIFQLFKGIQSTAELPAGCVLGLTVDDPRLTKKRGNVMPDVQSLEDVDEELRRNLTLRGIPSLCAQSALWDQSTRDNVTYNKMSDQELNRMRSDLLVPGSEIPVRSQSKVPILLVHQAGKRRGVEKPGWGSGWDLLLPKGWGMAFWIPLVYCGVRVGGLQMSLKHSQNKGEPHFPHDFPDCPAGGHFQAQQGVEMLDKFKRFPPSKRTNYIKHGFLAPFRCPWQQLVEEWREKVTQERNLDPNMIQNKEVSTQCGTAQTPSSAFMVLRSRRVLKQLSEWCQPSSPRSRVPRGSLVQPLSAVQALPLQMKWERALLWVRVSVLGKGNPELHAMLCIPTAEDLQRLREDPLNSGPIEPHHMDHRKRSLNSNKGGLAGGNHTKGQDHFPNLIPQDSSDAVPAVVRTDSTSVRTDPESSSALESPSVSGCTDSIAGLVQGLWSEPLPCVLSHCSRLTLGWITQGDFSLATGGGEALGFVSLVGFLDMLLKQPADLRGTMLLRNPSSLQYRYVKICIEA